MRVFSLSLLLSLGLSAASAQGTAGGKAQSELLANQGRGNQIVSGLALDRATWAPSLARVTPEEIRFFRTFRVGVIRDTARVDYGGEGAVVIGIEVNVSNDTKGKKINSLRAVYSAGGKKVYGTTLQGKRIKILGGREDIYDPNLRTCV